LSTKDHKKADRSCVRCAVLTVSDSRTVDTDRSGALLIARIKASGHALVAYDIVHDEPDCVRARVSEHAKNGGVDVVLVNGGTGIAPRDTTYEAISSLLERRLDGFGELFRTLSFEEIGAAAMLSRAVAGVVGSTAIFSMPGSTAACSLAADRLILPELGHIVGLLRPAGGDD
jgi:molybdenum cofactor biosynthesis protein B